MANYKRNIATHGLSGRVGDFVYRQFNGRTVVGKAPTFTKPPSEAQLKGRAFFGEAAAFAKRAAADPATRSYYLERAKGGQTAYNVALSDYYDQHGTMNGDENKDKAAGLSHRFDEAVPGSTGASGSLEGMGGIHVEDGVHQLTTAPVAPCSWVLPLGGRAKVFCEPLYMTQCIVASSMIRMLPDDELDQSNEDSPAASSQVSVTGDDAFADEKFNEEMSKAAVILTSDLTGSAVKVPEGKDGRLDESNPVKSKDADALRWQPPDNTHQILPQKPPDSDGDFSKPPPG